MAQKHLSDISDDVELFIGWTGQSWARPQGSQAEGFSLFPDFDLQANGIDLTDIVIPPNGARAAGTVETLTVATALVFAQWHNAYLRLGTPAAPVAGYAKVLQNTASTITVEWQDSGTGNSLPANDTTIGFGYLAREDFKWSSYPQVRILTPFQPVSDDATTRDVPYPDTTQKVTVPGFVDPVGVTTHEDLGVLLPFTFREGIEGYGISELDNVDGGGAVTAVATTTMTFTTPPSADGLFIGGNLVVYWTDASAIKRVSWSRIGDNITTGPNGEFTGLVWEGDGQPDVTLGTVDKWTAWIPHWTDHPNSYLPGEGYLWPNSDPQPGVAASQVHNRPRGITTYAYGALFGEVLPAATRLALATGKRINVVHLGINGASIGPSPGANAFVSFPGRLGWWNYQDHATLGEPLPTSAFERTRHLLTTVLPNAMLAESNTRTPMFLGWVFSQGEADANILRNQVLARGAYKHSIIAYREEIRDIVRKQGYQLYENGAEMPFVHPRIAAFPYEDATFGGDPDGLVNRAIIENAASERFTGTVFVDDLPKRFDVGDVSHLNGVGEGARAVRISNEIMRMASIGLGYESSRLRKPVGLLNIFNRSLAAIGEAGSLTSVNDGSYQAELCLQHYYEAVRTLLQLRVWSWALRRVELQSIPRRSPVVREQFDYVYVIPPDMLRAIKVMQPVKLVGDYDVSKTLTATYSAEFLAAYRPDNDIPYDASPADAAQVLQTDQRPGVEYTIEGESDNGARYIYTNQQQAVLLYVAEVLDPTCFSSAFTTALTYHMASLLAGGLIKGEKGEAVSMRMRVKAAEYFNMASRSDAVQEKLPPEKEPWNFIPDHLGVRQ